MKILSCSEIANLAEEYGIEKSQEHLSRLYFKFIDTLGCQLRQEAQKLGLTQDTSLSGCDTDFIEVVKARLGINKFPPKGDSDNGYTVKVFHKNITLYCDKSISLGLNPDSYQQLASFLYDGNGARCQHDKVRKELIDSIKYWTNQIEQTYSSPLIQSALQDNESYNAARALYDQLIAQIEPLSQYNAIVSWDDLLRDYVIEPAKKQLESNKKSIQKASPDARPKYRTRYESALLVMKGADSLGLLKADEQAYLLDWDELVGEQQSECTPSELRQDFMEKVYALYNETIEQCNQRGTTYSKNKKKRLESQMALCNQLRERQGVDCFIDHSVFDRRVYHFNVVMNRNQVLMFRITDTPSIDDSNKFINIARIMDSISSELGTLVKLHSYAPPKKSVLNHSRVEPGNDLLASLSEMFKGIKGGNLSINKSHVTLTIPVDKLGWDITLRQKDALAGFSNLSERILQFYKAVKDGKFWVKGVIVERLPNY